MASVALSVFGRVFGGPSKVTNYLRAAAANPVEFVDIARINKAQGAHLLVSTLRHCFPLGSVSSTV
jgi:hypothetical protein